jgi:galactokinase/mevalonate kinase-like predicted kinase
MAVEQMLTTGGGWQDQSGAVFGGIKLLETIPGLHQKPVVRWLPDYLFGHGYANERVLLYYTGITRLAKNILQEIVRGMFLNARECLDVVRQIHCHADFTFDAIQRNDYEQLCSAVRTSWKLNQQLDSGTNPPEVQDILDRIGDDLAAAKLLGAGGGGYLMMFAKDASAGERIRRTLQENPTNSRARFVDMSVSQTGLEITRS